MQIIAMICQKATLFRSPEKMHSTSGSHALKRRVTCFHWPAYTYGYLKFLFDHRPNKDMTDEELENLAPWNARVQELCK